MQVSRKVQIVPVGRGQNEDSAYPPKKRFVKGKIPVFPAGDGLPALTGKRRKPPEGKGEGAERNAAQNVTSANLAISEGCNVNEPMPIQRVAP